MSSALPSTAASASSGTLLEKCVRGKGGLEKERGRGERRKQNRKVRMGGERNFQST